MKWQWEWKRECTFFIGSSLSTVTWIDVAEELGYPLEGNIVTFDGKHAEMWIVKQKLDDNAEKLFKKVCCEDDFLEKYRKLSNQLCSDAVKLAKKMSDPKEFPDEALGEYARDYYHMHGIAQSPVGTIRTLNRIGIKKLIGFLEGKVENVGNIVAILISTTKKSVVQQAEEELLQIAISGDKNRIKEYTKKYCWIPVGYADEEAWDEKHFLEELEKIVDPVGSLEKIKSGIKKLEAEKEKLLKELNPPKEIINLINVMSDFVYYKDYIRTHMNKSFYYSNPLFSEIASRLGVSLADIKLFSGYEIAEMIESGKFDAEEAEKRKKAFVVGVDGDQKILLSGKVALDFIQTEFKDDFSDTVELKGNPASSGKLEGEVLVIHKQEDYHGEKDFILVTPMTTPELMHIAKNALAIVTDEGGITCHAAIISRELGIPCIVGTKHATKVLKNGDIVYVDTSNRSVQKLPK